MSNMPDINKRQVGIRMPIELARKIEKKAEADRLSRSDEIISLLEFGTRNIVLDSDDYIAIAKEVKENEDKRNRG